MAKYFLAGSIMVCTVLVGAAVAQEQTPPPKPQEKATQQIQQEKPTPPKPQEKAAPQTPQEKATPPKQENAQPKADQQTQKPTLVQSAGDVVSIDAMKNELVIKDNAGVETILLITGATTITRGGKSITLADIKAGDKITSECEDTTDGFKAKTITVTSPAPSQ
jgi:outer membrane biosynthesis protein TonB